MEKKAGSVEFLNKKGHFKKPVLKVIREHCKDCCCGSEHEVRICHIEDCNLWPYRFGENPFVSKDVPQHVIDALLSRTPTSSVDGDKNNGD